MGLPRLFRLSCAVLLLGAASACTQAARPAAAPKPPVVRVAPLQIGEAPLVYEEVVHKGDRRYVGGTAYVLIDAPPEQVLALLEPIEAYWHVLPRVWDVKDAGREGKDRLVELEQGTQMVRGRYTVRVRTERAEGNKYAIRFVLDDTRPHSISDAYGSFGIEPYGPGRSLVTWKVRIDLGRGLIRWLFEDKVRKLSLVPPVLVRNYVDGHLERARAELSD